MEAAAKAFIVLIAALAYDMLLWGVAIEFHTLQERNKLCKGEIIAALRAKASP